MSLKRFLIITVFTLIILLGFLFWISRNRRLKIYFFDVGQGDGIYIRTKEGRDIVIDGGPSSAILSKLGTAMPFYDRAIDIAILSHPHADHVIGLLEILKNYRVREIYLAGAPHTTYEYLEFLQFLKNHPEIKKVKVDHRFDVILSSNTRLEFLYPDFDISGPVQKGQYPFIEKRLNNTSVVARFVSPQISILLTGDIEEEAEAYLVSKNYDLNAQILKVSHQGSKTSSTLPFLTAASPATAIISVAADNPYGHPHKDALLRLKERGISILRTDEKGDIVFSY